MFNHNQICLELVAAASNIHILRLFTTGRFTIVLQQYATHIVLQYYVPIAPIALRNHKLT